MMTATFLLNVGASSSGGKISSHTRCSDTCQAVYTKDGTCLSFHCRHFKKTLEWITVFLAARAVGRKTSVHVFEKLVSSPETSGHPDRAATVGVAITSMTVAGMTFKRKEVWTSRRHDLVTSLFPVHCTGYLFAISDSSSPEKPSTYFSQDVTITSGHELLDICR